MTAGMLDETEARLNIYTDDPILAMYASEARRKTIMSTFILLWLLLGFGLAYHKGQRGTAVTWVGYDIVATPTQITASIKEEFMRELGTLTRDIGAKNVMSKKTLQSFAGKANHIANLLRAWRPFLDSLWAALYCGRPSWAPKGMIWTRQVRHTL